MDNLCHTLAGAALGEAGLKHRSRFGAATLMIAANLPDIDALVFATDVPSVAIRRGWTHGVLAQALLPVGLAAAVVLVARLRGAHERCSFRGLLLLSYVGVLSHVALDLLNNYGVRLLMPFSNRWFYGDAVFIIDPWLWLTLGFGVARSLRRGSVRPARTAVAIACTYILLMVGSARAARAIVLEEWRAARGGDPRALMVGPVPVTPLTRAVIVDAGDHYETGTFTWFPRRVIFHHPTLPKRDDDPAVAAAAAVDPRMRAVLVWSRFPYYEIDRSGEAAVVTLRDVRYGDRVGAVRAAVAASPGSSRRTDPSR